MSDLRKAAEAALEALEIASRNGSDGLKRYELKELDDAITALRAALAQPEPEPLEPVMFNGLTELETDRTASVMGLTPFQRKRLTDEALMALLPGAVRLPPGWKDFARAIEKAHGIE